jgi:acetyl esterase/lipase
MSSIPIPESMLAAGRRLCEVRINPEGTVVGWVQRTATASTAELVIRRLGHRDQPHQRGDGPEEVVTPAGISTPHPDGGGAWCWAGNESVVLVGGDGSLQRVSLAMGEVELLVTAQPGRFLWSPSVSPDGQWLAWVSESEHDARIEVLSLDTPVGDVQLVDTENASFVMDPTFGANGLLAWHAWHVPDMPWDEGWIGLAQCVKDEQGYRVVAGPRVGAGAVGQPRWRGNDLAWIDDGDSSHPFRTARWVTLVAGDNGIALTEAGGRWIDDVEHGGPTWGAGQRTIAWDPRPGSDRVLVERNEAGFGRLTIQSGSQPSGTQQSGTQPSGTQPSGTQQTGSQQLGRGVHRSVDWAVGPDGNDRVVAIRQGATTPTSVVLYEAIVGESGKFERRRLAVGPVAGWDTHAVVEPESISWRAPDGALVRGRLYRPGPASDPSSESCPTVVSIHGGPTDQTRVGWNPRYVAYLAAGWQVFVPDHRGSTGWGRDYQQAMNTRWGDLDVSDVVSGVDHLVAQGLVDAKRVVVMGGSAGGFTALLLLAHHPNRFCGGVALYPVTDLARLDETTHRFEAHYTPLLVGPASRYSERSPINWAQHIAGPLLLLHGTADPVVGVDQSIALAERIRLAGGQVELVTYEGEGHSWKRAETTADEHRRVMEFLSSL